MRAMQLTPELVYAAGCDAATRSMRAAGRERWDDTDYNAAVRQERALLRIARPALAALLDRDDPLDSIGSSVSQG